MLMYPLLQCHDLLNFYCFYVHAFSFVTTFRILFIPCISYLVLSKYISIRTYIFFSGELFCKWRKKKKVLSVPIKPRVPVDYRFPVKHFAQSCTFWKCFKNVSARHLHKCRPPNISHLTTFVYHLKLSRVDSQGWQTFTFLTFLGALDSIKNWCRWECCSIQRRRTGGEREPTVWESAG